ncbi:Immunity protein Imm1 [Amycolatopsis arida]|uniref:Immunity protein Imm1 n=1 Tax=Amycolatopsis arida TaxID=587909 RepID=A0A1I5K9H2_9PSEU|nr:Imm1 family immunity protein [Amycolatopsis arida]TDX96948.1 immunity protein Imm1 of predicted polymorphic toxin system [Amycolatopsis arida]SFO81670.1 Immunity protein Imm1 [Amycolatopsis arida]
MSTKPGIARQDAYDITKIREANDLLAMMKAVNEEREKPDAGVVWWLYAGADAVCALIAGVRGERGALLWSEPTKSFIPEAGINDKHVDYFTWESHHHPQRPGSEVPIDLMYRAVTEYVATQERPTCVNWIVAPDPYSGH